MSKNVKGYMGIQVGKLGPAVGKIFRGRQVYAAYNSLVNNPNTKRQAGVRKVFTAYVTMAKALYLTLLVGMKEAIKGTSRDVRNAFFHENYKRNVITLTSGGELSFNYADMIISKGGLYEVSFGNPDFDTAGQVKVNFETLETGGEGIVYDEDDLVYICVYQPDTKKSVLSDGVKRSALTVTCEVPAAWSGLRAHVYGFAVGKDDPDYMYQNMPSDSTYIGQGDIN